jgi:hypothetical protein
VTDRELVSHTHTHAAELTAEQPQLQRRVCIVSIFTRDRFTIDCVCVCVLGHDGQALSSKVDSVCAEQQALISTERLSTQSRERELQSVVDSLRGELSVSHEAANRQVAELQVLLSDAVRRAEGVAQELRVEQQRHAEAMTHADSERQRMVEQHLKTVQVRQHTMARC